MRRPKGDDPSRQLSLSLNTPTKKSIKDERCAKASVIPFMDAATISIRQDALRRVRNNGIFNLSSSTVPKK